MSYFRLKELRARNSAESEVESLSLFALALLCGQEWIRTTEVERQRIYSPPHLAALEPALLKIAFPLPAPVFQLRAQNREKLEDQPHASHPLYALLRATCRNRTNDLLITNQLLYQLS